MTDSIINVHDNLAVMAEERRTYTLQALPKHLAESGETVRLRSILTNYSFVEAKAKARMIYDLIREYQSTIQLWRHHHETAREQTIRKELEGMPKDWRPVVERDDRIEIAFWDREEFMCFVQHHILWGPKIEKNIAWVSQSYSKLYYKLAFEAIERKAYYDALEAVAAGLQLESDHPMLLCERGLALSQLGRYDAARDAYREALLAREWTPPSVIARALRGEAVALIDLNQLEEAEERLNMSLSLDPGNSTAQHELIYIEYLRQGGSNDAKGIIVNVPDELEAWYWFIDNNSHQLAQQPELLLQQALNQPDDSPVYRAALKQRDSKQQIRLRWVNKSIQTTKSTLQRTLAGHTGTITSIAITPDSKSIVSGSLDETIRVWDLDAGECLRVLHQGARVRTVSITSDGDKVLSGDDKGVIRLWDIRTGRCDAILQDHNSSIRSIICTGKFRAYSGGDDGILRIWDLKTAECTGRLHGPDTDIHSITIMPDETLMSVSSSGRITRWNPQNNSCVTVTTGVDPGLGSGIKAIKEDKVAVVNAMAVQIISAKDGSRLNTIKCHSGSIKDLAVTPDGQYLVTCGVDRLVQVTQIETCEQIATLSGHTFCVYAVEVSPNGKYIASGGGFDDVIKIWDFDSINESAVSSPSIGGSGSDRVQSIALSYDDKFILSTHGESFGHLCVRGVLPGHFVRVLGSADQVYVDPVTKKIKTVTLSSGLVQEWSLEQFQPMKEFLVSDKELEHFAFSEGSDMCAYLLDTRIEVMNLSDKQIVATFDLEEDKFVRSIAINPDATVVIVLEMLECFIWEVKTGNYQVMSAEELLTSKFMFFQSAVDFAGSLIIAGDVSGNGLVIDYITRDKILTVKNSHPISAVAVNRASDMAVTGSMDGSLRVWSLTNQHCVATFHAEGPITACSITSNNRILCGTITGHVYLLEPMTETV
jgi:WD40 repeat protein